MSSHAPSTPKRRGASAEKEWRGVRRDYKVYQQNTKSNKSIKKRKRTAPNRDGHTKIAGIPFGTMANTSHLLSHKAHPLNHSPAQFSPTQTLLPFVRHNFTITETPFKTMTDIRLWILSRCFVFWILAIYFPDNGICNGMCRSFVPYQQFGCLSS